jgi:predicted acyltransferase
MEKENKTTGKRLYSLDALRGFDMFWIMGGAGIFAGLATLTNSPALNWWAGQLEHVPWDGFKFYDMIFPLFLFIAGISFPFSMAKRTARNESRISIYRHVISRGLILVLLGIIYNNAVRFDLGNLRYGSVLGRIGLAWMLAAIIFMNTKLTWRIVWFCALLIGYWMLLLLFPAHDLGSTDPFSQTGNFASYIDRLIMPGQLYRGNHDPEGLMSTMPAISTALLGMFTGEFMMADYLNDKPIKKVLYLLLAAITLMILGKIWDLTFPINKNLWGSSFVCFVGGLSLLLFAIFYLIIDIWNFRKWAFFFVVIGMNPITIYLANRIINFNHASDFFFKGLIALFPENWGQFLGGIAYTFIGWIFLYFLYRKKIFLKV